MKFRKKSVVIDAVQYKPFADIPGVIEVREITHLPEAISPTEKVTAAFIETLEGRMTVSDGDWIITGVNGEKYPCKPDIFEKTYEAVTE